MAAPSSPSRPAAPKNYTVLVKEWYDGDTCTVDVHLGLGVVLTDQKVRLFGIDTPERRGGNPETRARAESARSAAIAMVPPGAMARLCTFGDRRCKYGRILGEIWPADPGASLSVNACLLRDGHAVEYTC